MDEKTLRILEFDKIKKRLVGLAVSQPGKEIAEELVPETNISKIERMQKETGDGVNFIIRRGSPPMGGVHDIRGSIKRVELGAVLGPGELLKISDTLRACRNLKGYAGESQNRENDNIVESLISSLVPNRRIEDKIAYSITGEDEIADGASVTLGNIRRQVRDLQNSIRDRLNDIVRSSKYQKYMQDSIVTMRADRYVVPVKQEYKSEIPGLVHDASSSGATIFVEPMAVVEANNNIRQLKAKEQAEIERILRELTADVAGILDSLAVNSSVLSVLDFVFAKAKLALDLKCVRPLLNEDGKTIIKKGRHPLLDHAKVVPIDFWTGEDFTTLVITGPNTGGKTVTLKTVGLFTIMAQSGLQVPAGDGTVISTFNKIFADIGDEQSIEQSLSTFSSHMKNIVRILEAADDRSLVMFDELGAGTDPTEGAALAIAVLEHLHDIGTTVVATTHYSELKLYAISTDHVENACCEFDVETLRPTYKLLIGVPGKSNAFAISKRLGLTDDILERAKDFLSHEDVQFEDILISIEKNRSEAEKERMQAEIQRLEIEKLKNELSEQKNKLSAQKENALKSAREEAKRILIGAKRDAEEILDELKRLKEESDALERERASEQIKQKLKKKVGEIEEGLAESLMPRDGLVKPPKNLKPGDSVLIVNLNQRGTVLTPPSREGEALIQAGVMKINVHVTNLRLVNEEKREAARTGSGFIGMSKSRVVSTELDLRGQNLDGAIEAVDKFLDDATIAGLKEVTIIHGKGTGVLRSGIQQYLRSNSSRIKSFRLGKYGEGENGVTIVEL